MKKLIKSLFVIMFLSLFTSSTLVFADEKENEGQISLESQKKDIDNLVEIGSDRAAADLAKYKIDDKGISDEQKKELLEYKSKASDELKQKMKNREEYNTSINIVLGAAACLFLAIGVFFAWKDMNR